MAVAPRPSDRVGRVSLDWIYIRTRTLVVLAVVIVCCLAGAGWWWFGGENLPLETQAALALSEAESLLVQARAVAPRSESCELAGSHLSEARTAFDSHSFTRSIDEARTAGVLCRDLLEGGGVDQVGVRISRTDGDVRYKRSGQFMWEPVTKRSMLAVGDQIRTGSGGSAELIFFDGTRLTVESGTLLEIRELHRDSERREHRVSERLRWGKLKATTPDTADSRGVHEVSTASAAVRTSEKAEFTVEHDREKGHSQITALRGDLTLQTQGQEVTIYESTRVSLDKGTVIGQSKILGPPMLSDPPDQRTFLAPRESQVHLSWLPLRLADSYHLQVSERPLFSRLEYEAGALRSHQTTLPPVKPGTYYWRVSGIDGEGISGRWSDTRKFRVLGAKFQDPDDREPPVLEVSEILVIGTNAIITGRSEPGSLVWIAGERVDVDESGAFTWVIKLHRDGENRIPFQAQDAAGNETNRVGYAFVDVF